MVIAVVLKTIVFGHVGSSPTLCVVRFVLNLPLTWQNGYCGSLLSYGLLSYGFESHRGCSRITIVEIVNGVVLQ